jgi:hypothetical protein
MNIFSAIKRTTFYMLLASVYLAFFAVQCVYNFDVSNLAAKEYFGQQLKTETKNQHPFSVTSQQHTAKKNIRLNKRFQPETLPAIVSIVDTPSITYAEKTFFFYNEKAYTATIYQTSLRGPPAVI